MTSDLETSAPRVGYVPMSPDLISQPGDYRRFVEYAKVRGIEFEIARWGEVYDLVVLSERADITMWCDYPHGKIVYDLIDSYLAVPGSDLKGVFRGVAKFITKQHQRLQLNYWESIRRMCRRADAVICSTDMQRDDIRPFCSNIHIILDIHNDVIRKEKHDYSRKTPLKLVWEGLPCNIKQIGSIQNVLLDLSHQYELELHLVTDLIGSSFLGKFGKVSSKETAEGIFKRVVVHAWSKETCADIICNADIAIIPIDLNNPMAVGKPENKLLLLWRMGMPVVTSATPAYERAMSEVGVSLTCKDDAEWMQKLGGLIVDEGLRREAGELGKKYANQKFSKEKLLEQWDSVFASIGFHFPKDI